MHTYIYRPLTPTDTSIVAGITWSAIHQKLATYKGTREKCQHHKHRKPFLSFTNVN